MYQLFLCLQCSWVFFSNPQAYWRIDGGRSRTTLSCNPWSRSPSAVCFASTFYIHSHQKDPIFLILISIRTSQAQQQSRFTLIYLGLDWLCRLNLLFSTCVASAKFGLPPPLLPAHSAGYMSWRQFSTFETCLVRLKYSTWLCLGKKVTQLGDEKGHFLD